MQLALIDAVLVLEVSSRTCGTHSPNALWSATRANTFSGDPGEVDPLFGLVRRLGVASRVEHGSLRHGVADHHPVMAAATPVCCASSCSFCSSSCDAGFRSKTTFLIVPVKA